MGPGKGINILVSLWLVLSLTSPIKIIRQSSPVNIVHMVLPPGKKNSVENIGEWISRGNRIRALVSFKLFRGPDRTIGIVYKYAFINTH